jgi:hypothetical protein
MGRGSGPSREPISSVGLAMVNGILQVYSGDKRVKLN